MHHPLGTLLRQEHMLREEDLERVERLCREHACSFEEAVTRLDLMTPELLDSFKEHLPSLAFSELADIDPGLVDLVPAEVARRYQCLPVANIGGTLTVALADPTDEGILEILREETGRTVDAVPALENDLEKVLELHYPSVEGGDGTVNDDAQPARASTGDEASAEASEDPPPAADPPLEETLEELEAHPKHSRAEVVTDDPDALPEQVVLANRLLCQLVVREGNRLEVRWKGDVQAGAVLHDRDGDDHLAAIAPARAAQVIQRWRVMADLLMASRKTAQKGRMKVPMRYEDETSEDRLFELVIVPIGDLEGEVATVTPADRNLPQADAGSKAPSRCPGCGGEEIRPLFRYCPLCGIAVG